MGNIIFDTAATFNGFIADEKHSLDWLFAVRDEAVHADGADDAGLTGGIDSSGHTPCPPAGSDGETPLYPADASVQVMGSTTYEWVLRQERLLESPERWAEFFDTTPVYVFSSRKLDVPLGADVRLVSGTVVEHLDEIRAAAQGGDIWIVGGGDLAGQFLEAGALDRITLSLAPVALTGGAPLFTRNIGADRLRLAEVRQVGQFARITYEVGAAQAGSLQSRDQGNNR